MENTKTLRQHIDNAGGRKFVACLLAGGLVAICYAFGHEPNDGLVSIVEYVTALYIGGNVADTALEVVRQKATGPAESRMHALETEVEAHRAALHNQTNNINGIVEVLKGKAQ